MTGRTVTASRTITEDDPELDGHYPGCPIFPGVFVVDEARRAIVAEYDGAELTGVDSVRFVRPVLPGDTLVVTATCAPSSPSTLRALVRVSDQAGDLTAKMTLSFAVEGDLR